MHFKKYKDWIRFNKELLIAELGAFLLGPVFAFAASAFSSQMVIIALSASVGDYIGYTVMYALSSLFDNRTLYWKERRITSLYYSHLGKFIIGAAFVDVIYYFVRTLVTYVLLLFGLAPAVASVASQLTTLLLYFILMNIMGSVMHIIKK